MKLDTFDFTSANALVRTHPMPLGRRGTEETNPKWLADRVSVLIALIPLAMVAALLLVLNPIFNPGPLFYKQDRMGVGGRRFRMWKFRTMSPSTETRLPGAPLERDRVTPLGAILRRTRLDELPNFLNVWQGDMSLVGPRPEAWDHAVAFSRAVPGYAERFRVRPGITGLAQVRGGYADCPRGVRLKARLDRYYVERATAWLEVYIVLRTVRVMLTGFGAK